MQNQSKRRKNIKQKQGQMNMKGFYYQDMIKLVRSLLEPMKEEIHMVVTRSLSIIPWIEQTVLS